MSATAKPEKAEVATVFVDTNTFYDFNNLDQIKWLEVVSAKRVILIIAPVVFRELNDHKDGGHKPHLAERAASVLKNIDRFFDAAPDDAEFVPIMDNVDLHGESFDAEVLPPYNPRMGDDQLVANILSYQAEHPDQLLYLATADRGLKLKCRGKGIQFLTLPDKYLSLKTVDPRDKKIKALEKTLEAMQNQIHKLVVAFNGMEANALRLDKVRLTPEDWVHTYTFEEINGQRTITLPRNTAAFNFIVANDGTYAAQNVHAVIILPEHCRGFYQEPYFKTLMDPMRGKYEINITNNSRLIEIECQNLNHGFRFKSADVHVTFPIKGTYELHWSAYAANLPEPSRGSLVVEVVD